MKLEKFHSVNEGFYSICIFENGDNFKIKYLEYNVKYKQKYTHGKDSGRGLNANQTLNRLNEKRYRGPAYFVNALSPYTFIIIC